ncbi:MAG: hypothetical protein WD876_01905 [Candidatus Pacearchaeota archaeon]
MGKFFTPPYNSKNSVPDDIINDISEQLSIKNAMVVLTYDPSKTSRKSAIGLLKKLSQSDVYRVLITDEQTFQGLKMRNPKTIYYPISIDEMFHKLFNTPDLSSR